MSAKIERFDVDLKFNGRVMWELRGSMQPDGSQRFQAARRQLKMVTKIGFQPRHKTRGRAKDANVGLQFFCGTSDHFSHFQRIGFDLFFDRAPDDDPDQVRIRRNVERLAIGQFLFGKTQEVVLSSAQDRILCR